MQKGLACKLACGILPVLGSLLPTHVHVMTQAFSLQANTSILMPFWSDKLATSSIILRSICHMSSANCVLMADWHETLTVYAQEAHWHAH